MIGVLLDLGTYFESYFHFTPIYIAWEFLYVETVKHILSINCMLPCWLRKDQERAFKENITIFIRSLQYSSTSYNNLNNSAKRTPHMDLQLCHMYSLVCLLRFFYVSHPCSPRKSAFPGDFWSRIYDVLSSQLPSYKPWPFSK